MSSKSGCKIRVIVPITQSPFYGILHTTFEVFYEKSAPEMDALSACWSLM